MEKQAGFKLHMTLVCYYQTIASLKRFPSCWEHEWYTRRFLLPFIQRYLWLPIFCGNFWKARKNIPVFENDSPQLFKIIFQSLVNVRRCVDVTNTNLHKYKNNCDGSKDRLDTKILSRFSKLPDKNLSLVLFLSPKNLTSLKLYTQVLLAGAFAVVRMVAAMFLEK